MQPSSRVVLCVDDDEDDRSFITTFIRRSYPYLSTIEANNGLEALNYLYKVKGTSEVPCLILLDINMPLMDGKTALTRIKGDEDFSSIPIVVFSTSSSSVDHLFCAHFGVQLITKPQNFGEIEATLHKIISYCEVG